MRNLQTVFLTDRVVYIPTNSAPGFPIFLHPYQHFLFLIFIFFNDSCFKCHILCVRWYLLVVSVLHFPNDLWCWAYFHVPAGRMYAFFGKKSLFSSSAHFLISVFIFLLSCVVFKNFLPFCRLPFHFADFFFYLLCRDILVWCSPTYWILPLLLVFWCKLWV